MSALRLVIPARSGSGKFGDNIEFISRATDNAVAAERSRQHGKKTEK